MFFEIDSRALHPSKAGPKDDSAGIEGWVRDHERYQSSSLSLLGVS
jgi:hypothetical protein